ncbi:MAG: MnhB domain-containing protein [Acidimicrobiia bacterium]
MNIRPSPLLATGTRTMVPTLVLFSIYLVVVGHDVPGGGFAGGLIASAALLLVFLSFGARGLRKFLPIEPEMIIGLSLGTAILAGLVGLFTEGMFLTYTYGAITVPLIGEIKLSSLLLFDLGVYGLVVGLIATATLRLGAERP